MKHLMEQSKTVGNGRRQSQISISFPASQQEIRAASTLLAHVSSEQSDSDQEERKYNNAEETRK